jgi:hypothetical protein
VIAANSINLAISALERASREISIPKIAPTSPEQTRLTSSVNPSRTLASAYNAAVDLRALGEYQRARALDEDTLTRYRRVLGDDHPHTLASADNLAVGLGALGEHEQARQLQEWIRSQRGIGHITGPRRPA